MERGIKRMRWMNYSKIALIPQSMLYSPIDYKLEREIR
jgi:hypothetical protein